MSGEKLYDTMALAPALWRPLETVRRPEGKGSPPAARSCRENGLQGEEEDIYVGEGRIIRDDPQKYPSKDDAGPMQGPTPDRGDVVDAKFLEAVDANESEPQIPLPPDPDPPRRVGEGQDTIYVGFDYSKPAQVAQMRDGQSGRFIIDDVSKYPGKDFLGWMRKAHSLAGTHFWGVALQGGFAGGEMGLQKFLEEGDVRIAAPDEKGTSQMSPVLIGIFVAAVATTGGLLLTDAITFGENFTVNVNRAPLDDKTKLLLEVAVGLLVTAWGGSVVLAFLKTAREKITAGTSVLQRLAVSVAFWTVVLVATYNLAKT